MKRDKIIQEYPFVSDILGTDGNEDFIYSVKRVDVEFLSSYLQDRVVETPESRFEIFDTLYMVVKDRVSKVVVDPEVFYYSGYHRVLARKRGTALWQVLTQGPDFLVHIRNQEIGWGDVIRKKTCTIYDCAGFKE